MPLPTNSSWVYIPSQMDSLGKVGYTYDTLPALAPTVNVLSQRLARLGAVAAAANVKEEEPVDHGAEEELLGASESALPIKGASAATTVKLMPRVRARVIASLAAPSVAAPPRSRLPVPRKCSRHPGRRVAQCLCQPAGRHQSAGSSRTIGRDHPGCSGLRRASRSDEGHSGDGLDFNLEITDIVDTLHLRNELDTDSIHVTILPQPPVPDSGEVTVGRVVVLAKGRSSR